MIASLTMLLLLQDEALLRYGGERGAKATVVSELTLDLDIKGSEQAVTHIRTTSPFFSFSKIHWRAEGERRVERVDRKSEARTLRTDFAQARVDGVYDDEKYEYDFERGAPPGDLKDDKLKGMLWAIAMSGHPQTLTPAGELRAVDPNQDAFGEVLMHFAWPVARLSEKAVKAGDTWESKWRGERKDKQNQSQFDFVQKSKLEKLADGRAEISCELAGTSTAGKSDEHTQKTEGKSRLTLDTKRGLVVAWESESKLTVQFKGTDPGSGEALEVTVVFAVRSKMEEKP